MAKTKRTLRCPVCGRLNPREDQAPRPFCSERCRLIDRVNWLGEGYVIPGRPAGAHDDQDRERKE